jgi:hypothetical protein
MSVVSLERVSKEFGQGGVVGAGDRPRSASGSSLIGPSGCGKSTLFASSATDPAEQRRGHRQGPDGTGRLGRDYGSSSRTPCSTEDGRQEHLAAADILSIGARRAVEERSSS